MVCISGVLSRAMATLAGSSEGNLQIVGKSPSLAIVHSAKAVLLSALRSCTLLLLDSVGLSFYNYV